MYCLIFRNAIVHLKPGNTFTLSGKKAEHFALTVACGTWLEKAGTDAAHPHCRQWLHSQGHGGFPW